VNSKIDPNLHKIKHNFIRPKETHLKWWEIWRNKKYLKKTEVKIRLVQKYIKVVLNYIKLNLNWFLERISNFQIWIEKNKWKKTSIRLARDSLIEVITQSHLNTKSKMFYLRLINKEKHQDNSNLEIHQKISITVDKLCILDKRIF